MATTRIWMSLAVACICYSDSNYSVDRSHNQSDIIADERRIRLNFIHCSVYNYPTYNDTCLVALTGAAAVIFALNEIKTN